MLECGGAVIGCGLDVPEHGQDARLQILELRAKQCDADLVALERILELVQRLDGVEKCSLRGLAAGCEGREHFVGVEAEALEGFGAAVAAVFRSDVELLDGVGHFVDAEQAGVSTFHERAHELIGAQAEGRKLRRVFVQGVEQVAVFVCAVLCAGGD